jgi:hypothetical protein
MSGRCLGTDAPTTGASACAFIAIDIAATSNIADVIFLMVFSPENLPRRAVY